MTALGAQFSRWEVTVYLNMIDSFVGYLSKDHAHHGMIETASHRAPLRSLHHSFDVQILSDYFSVVFA